jgi:hypothetical protein
MHKNTTKCNETLSKWCKNKHEASKIIDTFETYHRAAALGSTRHFEISLAAICPSCSSLDKISSSKLQGSQLPPDVSGIADFVFVDLAEVPVASDVVA